MVQIHKRGLWIKTNKLFILTQKEVELVFQQENVEVNGQAGRGCVG
jgi:hypothetical protein